MKKAELNYYSEFPFTTISEWVGARRYGWTVAKVEGQQFRKPKPQSGTHPFVHQRNVWCLLEIHLDGIDLRFAMPQELDHFVDILSQNPLPSGRSLEENCSNGHLNKH